jgi:flagellar biosynthesis regulator FlbT
MGLKITLKPFERIEIGPLTLTNGWLEPSTFLIEGIAPVLRQANTLLEDQADTSLKQVYLCVQKLFLRREGATIAQYQQKAAQLLEEMPAAETTIHDAGRDIAEGRLYVALRRYRELMDAIEADDKRRSALSDDSAPCERGSTRTPPSVHFVRDRRRYRLGAAGVRSA